MKTTRTRNRNRGIRNALSAILMTLATAALVGCTSARMRDRAAPGGPPRVADADGFRDAGIMEGDPIAGDGRRDVVAPVYFDYDSAVVPEGERAKVERMATVMRARPRTSLVVEGHSDERGSSEYNLALGERRALAVRAYLVSLGIESARLQTRSFGEEAPARPGHAEEDWQFNRRGEFVVFGR